METNIQGIFAAGDIVRGASLVVWAIRDGREAAVSINEYLKASDYFVENSQKGYLNAILDKISKVSRIKDEI